MGLFSWNCPACEFSIRSPYAISKHTEWMNACVALFSDDVGILGGNYDGYGRIEFNLGGIGRCSGKIELPDSGFALYHRACWLALGRPEFLVESRHADDQGHFVSDDEAPKNGPFDGETWILLKRPLGVGNIPYSGPACKRANVRPGRIYRDPLQAKADRTKLNARGLGRFSIVHLVSGVEIS